MSLREAFDIRFEQLLVRYRSPLDPTFPEVYGYRSDSESSLNLGLPGVKVLLGKNGSGKSRLLNGIKAFGNKQKELTPEVILRYSIPSIEEHLAYLDAREYLLSTEEMILGMNDSDEEPLFKKKRLDLPFHDLVIRSAASSILNVSFRDSFGFEASDDVLRFFGFSEPEIEAFQKRMVNHYIELGPYHPAQSDLFDEPRENLNFRDYFPEFFLALLANSFVHNNSFEVGPGSAFRSTDYYNDSTERVRLVAGLRELFEGANHVDLMCDQDEIYLSLVNDGNWSSALPELLQAFEVLKQNHDVPSFPFDLFRSESLPSAQFLKVNLDLNNDYWEPFEVSDLTFYGRNQSIEALEQLFLKFVELEVIFDDGPNYEVKVSGLDYLDQMLKKVNKLLTEIEIGISEVALQKPGHRWPRFEGEVDWGVSEITHDFAPIIGWKDSVSERWLPIASCSDGQLDVLRILVQLCGLMESETPDSAKFMLIDEFDRHLHPIVSQQLLDLIERYAKKSGTYVIASTHTVGSLAIHKCTQLFAVKDLSGFHSVSTNRHQDPKVLAHHLGVPEIDVRKLVKLFVLVEGDHEEIILNGLMTSEPRGNFDIEIINLNGLYGLVNFWRVYMQHEIADVLLVYDKQNSVIEERWIDFQHLRRNAKIVENLWENSLFDKLHRECKQRARDKSSVPGDTELNSIAFLLREILMRNQYQIRNIQRLHLHGVQVPDIVDCLPISAFPKAKSFGSWERLREENSHLKPSDFKKQFEINNSTVSNAARGAFDSVNPEIQRLWARILGIIEYPEDWPTE
jgi:energy-coupling factor transporter ATP-binding protein EcfA2